MEDSDRLPRKLAAILYADVAGYSRLTGEDEDATHRTLAEYLDVISSTIERHRGRVMHYAGDAVLAMFEAVVDALSCAAQIQQELKARNKDLPDERKVQFRIGVNMGDVIEDRGDIYGDGVNIAARLESLAEPGGICISESVQTAIANKLPFDYEFMGEQEVKNIAKPVKMYRAQLKPDAELPTPRVAPKDLHPKLRRIAGVTAMVAILAVAGTLAWLKPWESREEPAAIETTALPVPDKTSIAVLPFENFSSDPSLNYLSDGISEDIIIALARSPWLLVMSRISSFVYKGKSVTVQQVGQELGVRYVLEGSVQKGRETIRITAQLIDTSTGHHVWTDRFDEEGQDILALQDSVTEKITQSLASLDGILLSKIAPKDAWAKKHVELREYDYVQRGHALFLRWNEVDNAKAENVFQEGLERFPNSSLLKVKVGWTRFMKATNGWSDNPGPNYRSAFELGQEALADESAPLLTEYLSHWLLAWVYSDFHRDLDRALGEIEAAVALVPSNGMTRADLGGLQIFSGLLEEGFENVALAKRSDPYYVWIPFYEGVGLRMKGANAEAVEALQEFQIESPWKYGFLASSYMQLEMVDDAKTAVGTAMTIYPGFSVSAHRKQLSIKDEVFLKEYFEDLRKAGLPD